jgi:hypothetical protein
MRANAFLDTNVLIYAVAQNDPSSTQAEELLASGGMLSVQILNELMRNSPFTIPFLDHPASPLLTVKYFLKKWSAQGDDLRTFLRDLVSCLPQVESIEKYV